MKCQDVRRTLSLVAGGDVPLTEWAIIQTHLLGCAECRQEFERARGQAVARAHARRRRLIAGIAAAAATGLLVVVAGGLYVYRESLPALPGPDSIRLPTWGATPPPAAAPPTAAPVVPATAAPAPPPPGPPRPAVEPAPRAVAPPAAPAVEPAPRVVAPPAAPAAEPVPRAPRRAAGEATPGEAMPTQGGASARSAPSGAEPMPTQAPSRPAAPRRQ